MPTEGRHPRAASRTAKNKTGKVSPIRGRATTSSSTSRAYDENFDVSQTRGVPAHSTTTGRLKGQNRTLTIASPIITTLDGRDLGGPVILRANRSSGRNLTLLGVPPAAAFPTTSGDSDNPYFRENNWGPNKPISWTSVRHVSATGKTSGHADPDLERPEHQKSNPSGERVDKDNGTRFTLPTAPRSAARSPRRENVGRRSVSRARPGQSARTDPASDHNAVTWSNDSRLSENFSSTIQNTKTQHANFARRSGSPPKKSGDLQIFVWADSEGLVALRDNTCGKIWVARVLLPINEESVWVGLGVREASTSAVKDTAIVSGLHLRVAKNVHRHPLSAVVVEINASWRQQHLTVSFVQLHHAEATTDHVGDQLGMAGALRRPLQNFTIRVVGDEGFRFMPGVASRYGFVNILPAE